jgi:HTH-type transcriptional regulator / antitoxin HigA
MHSPIRPIDSEAAHDDAMDEIERLMNLNPPHGSVDADRLEVLCTLVEAWEREHVPLPPVAPAAILLFALEQGMVSRKDLETALGSSTRVTEVLSGKRALSPAMIVRLHEGFGLPAEPLVTRPRPELWLDLRGPGRASAKSAVANVRKLLNEQDSNLSSVVGVRAIALEDGCTTRVVLEADGEQELRVAESILNETFGPGVVDRRRVAWSVAA